MKIGDLVYDVLLEEIKNKKLFNLLLNKWFGDNPTQDEIDKCESIINEFTEILNQIKLDTAATDSFLDRFDGEHGSEYFDPKYIKDITKFSLKQITSIIGEYKDSDYVVDTTGGFSKSLKLIPENIEASEKLWESDENLIINEGPLRVYAIDKQSTSMKYGYYQQIMAKAYNGNQWCTTGRGQKNDSMTNLWGNYRHNRTFYYVIDERKKPTEDKYNIKNLDVTKYYLGALQVSTDVSEGFRLTSMVNDGDNRMNWNEVINIYPELRDHKDKFVAVKFDTKAELDIDDSIFARITETPGSQYEFRRMERAIKKAYINQGAAIKTLRSWNSMDPALKSHYILKTTDTSYKDMFQSWEIMNDIMKNATRSELDNRLNALGVKNGIGSIFANLMSTEFNVSRESLDNSSYVLYESKNTHKFGLYNLRSVKWVYEPTYSEIELEHYVDDDGNSYIVETYSQSSEPNESSFYCIFPVGSDSEEAAAHFITAKMFQQLSTKIHRDGDDEEDDSGSVRISDINPETDIDIKESIKRRK